MCSCFNQYCNFRHFSKVIIACHHHVLPHNSLQLSHRRRRDVSVLPQTIVVFLPSRVPQRQLHLTIADLDARDVRLEHGRHV